MGQMWRLGLLLTVLACWAASVRGQGSTQGDINRIARDLGVYYNVLSNLVITPEQIVSLRQNQQPPPPPLFHARITLTNNGKTKSLMEKNDWEIYFCHIYMIEPDFFDVATSQYQGGGIIFQDSKVQISFVKGCLFKLTPAPGFVPLPVGGHTNITFRGQYWSVSRTDKMPNWYVTSGNLKAKTIASTAGTSLSFVGLHDNFSKWKRVTPDDNYNPLTAEQRWIMNNMTGDMGGIGRLVLPTPKEIRVTHKAGTALDTSWVIYAASPSLNSEAEYLRSILQVIKISKKPRNSTAIILQIGTVAHLEGYVLTVNPDTSTVHIQGQTKAGVFYGVQTLLSLLSNSNVLPGVTIRDEPRYGFRGVHLDVARNFHPVATVLKLMDAMAMYKLNKLHLHLSDDEAWRLQIPGLEELTQVGSQRCHDLTERKCLLSQLGSGPDTSTAGSGFYTVEDYYKILDKGKQLHIEVIPEFEMPGRSRAAIVAMEARYHKYKLADLTKAKQYRLRDVNDTSIYMSLTTFFNDSALNPCMQSTYNFIDKIVQAIVDMHKVRQPLNTFHMGGDDAPFGVWVNSSECFKMFNNSVPDVIWLKLFFTAQVSRAAELRSLNLGTWEDGVMAPFNTPFNRSSFPSAEVRVNAWNTIWDMGLANRAYRLANAGYKVVISSASHLYFDHPYEPDPEEHGYYWGPRFVDTAKVFGFMPDDIYGNADFSRFGIPLHRDVVCGQGMPPCDPLTRPENILGIQAQLWTEVIRTGDQLEHQAFPRLLAFAERAWNKGSWETTPINATVLQEDWTQFVNTVGYKELARLHSLGIKYRLAPPGALVQGALMTNTEFPGIIIELSQDGVNFAPLSPTLKITAWPIYMRSKSSDGTRTSRVVAFVPASPPAPPSAQGQQGQAGGGQGQAGAGQTGQGQTGQGQG